MFPLIPSSHPQELRPRVSSFGEKDVIMEGVPSTPAQRRRSHYIVLTAHGIAEPGKAVVGVPRDYMSHGKN